MRKRVVFTVVVLLSGLLVATMFLGSGLAAVSKLLGVSFAGQQTSSTASVFVDPVKVINSRLQASNSSTFTLYMNISSVTDLFTWQINASWNPAVLKLNRILGGEFLLRTGSAYKTSSYQLGYVMNSTDDVKGYSAMSESVLGNVTGITGSGRLVALEFLVVGYGTSAININVAGSFGTSLLSSTGSSLSFTEANGWFSNKIAGDSNGDRIVNSLDIGAINAHWGANYDRSFDCNDDGVINSLDIGVINANWGRSI